MARSLQGVASIIRVASEISSRGTGGPHVEQLVQIRHREDLVNRRADVGYRQAQAMSAAFCANCHRAPSASGFSRQDLLDSLSPRSGPIAPRDGRLGPGCHFQLRSRRAGKNCAQAAPEQKWRFSCLLRQVLKPRIAWPASGQESSFQKWRPAENGVFHPKSAENPSVQSLNLPVRCPDLDASRKRLGRHVSVDGTSPGRTLEGQSRVRVCEDGIHGGSAHRPLSPLPKKAALVVLDCLAKLMGHLRQPVSP